MFGLVKQQQLDLLEARVQKMESLLEEQLRHFQEELQALSHMHQVLTKELHGIESCFYSVLDKMGVDLVNCPEKGVVAVKRS